MRFLTYVMGFVVVLLLAVYVMLFTGFGNSILRPVLQSKISASLGMPVELKRFHLSMSELDLIVYLTKRNGVRVYGNYSPFARSFDLKYDVKLLELSDLEVLTKQQLAGEFKTKGSLKGTLESIQIDGTSDVAKSATAYHVELTDFDVSSITAKVKSLQVAELLAMLKKPRYAYALLDLDLDFKDIKPHQLDGIVHLSTRKGHFVSAVVKKELGVTIPHTLFNMQADAKLKKDDIDYICKFDSNLAKLKTSGKVVPKPLKTDIVYKASVKELALLQPILNRELRGTLDLHGTLKGSKEKMILKLFSDVAESNTNVTLALKELQPSALWATVEHLRMEKLFYMLKQPRYAMGDLNLKTEIESLKVGALKGKVTTISTGSLNTLYLDKTYKFKHPMPKTSFRLRTISTLDGSEIDTLATLASTLLNLSVKKAHVDVQKGYVQSDYALRLPALDKLYFVTDRELKGTLACNGEIKGDRKKMLVTLQSDLAASDTQASLTLKELQPSSLQANISHLNLEKLFYMLAEPHYASGDLDLDADIKSMKIGALKGDVSLKAAGILDGKTLSKLNGLKKPMPQTNFKLQSRSELDGNYVDTSADLTSALADAHVKKARYDLQKSILDSDYVVSVPSLERLYFVTERDLRGSIKAKGEIHKAKSLNMTADAKIAGGDLKLRLQNNKLHADLSDMRTKKVLWMLKSPEILDGGMYAKLDYNTLTKRGVATAEFKDGRFVRNHVFDLLKEFKKVDLYREYFNGNAKANINGDKVAAVFDLKARKAEIKSNKTIIDTKHSTINSTLDIRVEKTPVVVTLTGNIAKPNVGLDLQSFMKSEVGKKLEKKADKEIKRFLKKLF